MNDSTSFSEIHKENAPLDRDVEVRDVAQHEADEAVELLVRELLLQALHTPSTIRSIASRGQYYSYIASTHNEQHQSYRLAHFRALVERHKAILREAVVEIVHDCITTPLSTVTPPLSTTHTHHSFRAAPSASRGPIRRRRRS